MFKLATIRLLYIDIENKRCSVNVSVVNIIIWQVNIIFWQVNIIIWQVGIVIWQVDIIIMMSTCQIMMSTCQIMMSACQMIMLTCQKNMLSTGWHKLGMNTFSSWILEHVNIWQVDKKIWQVDINIWQVDIKIWQVDIIIWQVVAEICHHTKQSTKYSLLHLYWNRLIWNIVYIEIKVNPQPQSLIFFANKIRLNWNRIYWNIAYIETNPRTAEVIMCKLFL